MKRGFSFRLKFAARNSLLAAGISFTLLLCLALPARADHQSGARDQFTQAVKMRTMLEGYLEKDRSLPDYKQTVAAYHKVYLNSPQAEEVTASLIAEAELYQEMGRLYDAKYFQSAVAMYNFLLEQYPQTRYRAEAEFQIAQIQQNNLDQPDAARLSYQAVLQSFPKSDQAAQARAALQQIAAASAPKIESPPDVPGQPVDPRVAAGHDSSVTGIHTWNSPGSTRIVVALSDTVQYDSARIASPDRIYFDLYKARISSKLSSQSLAVPDGLLKTIRVAQNRQGVVRVVLDADGAKKFSAFLVSNPYRLVIDLRASTTSIARAVPPPAATPARDVPVAESVAVNTNASSARDHVVAPFTPKIALPGAPAPKDTVASAASPRPPASEPKPTRDGQRSLTRMLGLKISRIVIDPGHGGHDTGTIGPHGLMEKDLCLDVALRLGREIEKRLPGAEVIYTRKDDTFVPLEERTEIANNAKADLFISIHANSSHDPDARGIETYYLNFATSPESMEVAARENANSQESLHDLQDLIRKIARNDKIEESKELASDIQSSLTQRLQLVSHNERNRGVKKAPFVVLIGANMPSVLSEISFVSNPNDERLLRKPDQRQRIADGLYRGIALYLDSLNSLSYDKQKLVSDPRPSDTHLEATTTVTPTGNPK
jgi:N-acetylmuramoyl-L-alanine amidase